MGRTESISIQVHPDDEQAQIDHMQTFHWNLLSTQEIKTVDNSLERRGDAIYAVRTSERYCKLTFSRELDLPNLSEIKKLEAQYYSLPHPAYPKLFPGSIFPWLIGAFFWGIGIVGWIAYYFLSYKPKNEGAQALAAQNERKREEIMNEMKKFR